MSFRTNRSQQMSLADTALSNNNVNSYLNLKKNKPLKIFESEIFPAIDEEPFHVLFSKGKNSRPNCPINVTIGLLLLKEYYHMSDDTAVMSLHTNPLFQYLLRTSSMPKQPMSERSLSRFRQYLLDYELLTGIDLVHVCLRPLFKKMEKMLNISGKTQRMDSLMIESNIKKLSRFELLFRTFTRLVKRLKKQKVDSLLEGLDSYLNPSYENEVIYRSTSDQADSRLAKLLADIVTLLDRCESNDTVKKLNDYKILRRVINEQTIKNEDGSLRLRTKADGGFSSKMVQSPVDTEATHRVKNDKTSHGFAGNLLESVSYEGGIRRSIIDDYMADQNIRSDVSFIDEYLNTLPDAVACEESRVTLVADGAYYSEANLLKAAEKNVDLVPTALTGKDVPDSLADFQITEDEDGEKKVAACPNGEVPKEQKYIKEDCQIQTIMDQDKCAGCPHYAECHPVMKHGEAMVSVSLKKVARAKAQRALKSERLKDLSHVRNGIEAVPSQLRNNFHIDKIPARGLARVRLWLGFKVGGLNLSKCFRYFRLLDKCAQNSAKS